MEDNLIHSPKSHEILTSISCRGNLTRQGYDDHNCSEIILLLDNDELKYHYKLLSTQDYARCKGKMKLKPLVRDIKCTLMYEVIAEKSTRKSVTQLLTLRSIHTRNLYLDIRINIYRRETTFALDWNVNAEGRKM